MSRVAEKPIPIPAGVEIETSEFSIQVKGPLGKLSRTVPQNLTANLENQSLKVNIIKQDKETRSQAGTFRSDLSNYVKGVSEGFSSALVLVKVGANAQLDGDVLVIKIGYSNPVRYKIPEGIKIEIPQPTEVVVKGINIQQVNQVAAEIIQIRPPEVYKGTGILKKGQRITLKAAKKK
jgi:large subunit ribosomal protein L6